MRVEITYEKHSAWYIVTTHQMTAIIIVCLPIYFFLGVSKVYWEEHGLCSESVLGSGTVCGILRNIIKLLCHYFIFKTDILK